MRRSVPAACDAFGTDEKPQHQFANEEQHAPLQQIMRTQADKVWKEFRNSSDGVRY